MQIILAGAGFMAFMRVEVPGQFRLADAAQWKCYQRRVPKVFRTPTVM